MSRADLAWRRALAAQNLDEIRQQAERQAPEAPGRLRAWLAAQERHRTAPHVRTSATETATETGSSA